MATKSNPIEKLTIKGFKSIRTLDSFPLSSLNILIGANGVGKSNFVSYFRMLGELVEQRLQVWTKKQGGADRILTYGVKETDSLSSKIEFGRNGYSFELAPTADGGFTLADEVLLFRGDYKPEPIRTLIGRGHSEANLREQAEVDKTGVPDYVYGSVSGWKVFHFHDTGERSGVKQRCSAHDNERLRTDASNLAAFLYRLKETHPASYSEIRKTVALAIPFFDDFVLRPEPLPTGEEQIWLLWRQKDSDYPFAPSQLSDGSLRFICLATALLQPNPPSTIVIDEPELGLHPYAITLLGALMRSASKRMQVIVSTQSVPLLDEFSVNDLVIVEREDGVSVFKRPEEDEYRDWRDDYSIGELWQKNILGGRPVA